MKHDASSQTDSIASVFGRFKVAAATYLDSAGNALASKMLHLQLRGAGDEGDDESAEAVDDAPFVQSLGLAVRPIVQSTLRALGIRWGAEVWPIKLWDRAKQPTDLESGETRLYGVGEPTARMRIRSNGDVNVTAKSGQVAALGGDAAATKFLIGDQEALRTWCTDTEAKLNTLIDLVGDLITKYNAHSHNYIPGTSGSASTGNPSSGTPPETETGATPSHLGDPPALSTKVKAI